MMVIKMASAATPTTTQWLNRGHMLWSYLDRSQSVQCACRCASPAWKRCNNGQLVGI